MFDKLFKKKQPIILIEDDNVGLKLAAEVAKGKYPVEVLQIHHEFHTAADKLVIEANSIIKQASEKNITKINRLEFLGFKQASQVTDAKPIIEKAKLSNEQLELLAYYQRNYPLNKFITEVQVKEICYKYNLICGEVSRFKGFVPEKNLKEIERFSLKKEDKIFAEIFDGRTGEILSHVSQEQCSRAVTDTWANKMMSDEDGFYVCNDNGTRFIGYRHPNDGAKLRYSKSQTLQICAPIKDMDLTGVTIEDGYKMKKVHIPDPVVLQPVKGGYLILTAWGDEASDELVVNNINN